MRSGRSGEPAKPTRRRHTRRRATVGEFEQAQRLRRLVAAILTGDGNARRLAAGGALAPDRLNNAANTVLETDRERMHPVDGRPPAFEKPTGALLATRHQRFLAPVHNKDCQFGYSEETCKGLLTRLLRAISPRQRCDADFKDFSASAAVS
jgi:hypothetical protein